MKVMLAVLIQTANIFIALDATAGDFVAGQTVFDRNDKVLTWKTFNTGKYDFTEAVGFELESTLSTSLNMTTGSETEDRWYHTVYNRSEINYMISKKLNMMFSAREEWNKDTMSRLGKSLLTTDYNSGIRYSPLENLSLDFDVGHIFDRRFDNRDKGIKRGGGIQYFWEPIKDISLVLNGRGNTSNLKRSQDSFLGTGRITFYHSDVDITMSLRDNFSQRGYFADYNREKIEKRKRHDQTLGLVISSGEFNNVSESTAYELTIDLARKIIDDTANDVKKSSKYQNNAKGSMKGFGIRIGKGIYQRVFAEWDFTYSKNPNGVERLNRNRTQTDIETRGTLAFGLARSDTVTVVGRIKRTRIDTPVTVTNDRDELKIEGGVLYNRYFTDNFKTGLDFRILETHYVNVDVSQSSQNKWLKTYLLSPSLAYSPMQSVMISHAINLYANYIMYDFDSDHAPRSSISRRVTSESWINISFSQNTRVSCGFMFEDNDYGRLNTGGNKIPAEEGLKRFSDISIDYRITDWFTISPQYVYAIRRDWYLSGDRTTPIRREIDQTYGLRCELFKDENSGVDIGLKRIVRNTRKYPVRIRNYITVELTYGF